jgi:hypothetical protein
MTIVAVSSKLLATVKRASLKVSETIMSEVLVEREPPLVLVREATHVVGPNLEGLREDLDRRCAPLKS